MSCQCPAPSIPKTEKPGLTCQEQVLGVNDGGWVIHLCCGAAGSAKHQAHILRTLLHS